jgi:hypothetical protein
MLLYAMAFAFEDGCLFKTSMAWPANSRLSDDCHQTTKVLKEPQTISQLLNFIFLFHTFKAFPGR